MLMAGLEGDVPTWKDASGFNNASPGPSPLVDSIYIDSKQQ
jgi:hypothetical protein